MATGVWNRLLTGRQAFDNAPATNIRPRVLIVCAYLRRDRTKAADRDFLQPLAGVHIGSCIDHDRYDVSLHHEMWHGPCDTAAIVPGHYAIVFLSGLQQDFDRMRQLSYFHRRAGAQVVAGGNICTLFPDFAAQFFDAVCVGGVEAVVEVMRDHERGTLGGIYTARSERLGAFPVAYHLLARSRIDVPVHLIEASRGCSFTCSFCILPAERSRHAGYAAAAVADAIDRSIRAAPRWSLRRRFPMLWFMDNNFSDSPAHLRDICAVLAADRRVRAWGALITQNVLRDRDLLRLMAAAKCRALFVGIESFDREFLRAMRKRQNLSATQSVAEDVMFAERLGIVIVYSQLIDPRHADFSQVQADLRTIARDGRLPLPAFISFVSPLVGTEMFWECIQRGELVPDLRLREMDGETIAFRHLRASPEATAAFARLAFAQTWRLVPRPLVLWNVLRRMLRARAVHPLRWLVAIACSWRIMAKSASYARDAGRSYQGGTDRLDPQYAEHPDDLSPADRTRYFEPILLTDHTGALAEWLRPYRPQDRRGGRHLPAARVEEHEDGLPLVR